MRATITLATPEPRTLAPFTGAVVESRFSIAAVTSTVAGFLSRCTADWLGQRSDPFNVAFLPADFGALQTVVQARLVEAGYDLGILAIDWSTPVAVDLDAGTFAVVLRSSLGSALATVALSSAAVPLLSLLLVRGQEQAAFPAGVATVA